MFLMDSPTCPTQPSLSCRPAEVSSPSDRGESMPPIEHADRVAAAPEVVEVVDVVPRPDRDRPRRRAGLVLSPRESRRAVHRARLMSDRTGRPLAIVTFACPSREAADLLERVLLHRTRATDEVGRSPRETCRGLGAGGATLCRMAILPDTRRDGATRFTHSVLGRLPDAHRPRCRIELYTPGHDDKLPGDPERSEDADVGDGRSTLFARRLAPWKRAADVAVAGVGLLVLAPMMALIAIAIRIDSRGPAIFRQKRAGLGGRTFEIAKFRTMVVDAEDVMRRTNLRASSEQDGAAFKLRNDPRVTRVGAILRATSLDELPQLWNVFVGEMTLVGPRPLPTSESDACLPWQRRRLDVTPGLTCIWQVHGRSRVRFDEWMRMDLRYVNNSRGAFGLAHDVTLLAKTLPAVFLKRGF